ncbi:hypothetical protein pipiens_000674, partial [Culex pipiens pipiens]
RRAETGFELKSVSLLKKCILNEICTANGLANG